MELSREQVEQITTAAIVEPDGTLRQVPTTITADNGKYYAKINSLANATYVLIRNEKEFSDVSGKWYEDYANEMASRMIMNGVGDNQFAGEKEVTRAEFAQIIVNALGLPKDSASTFNDVANNTWYTESVAAAHEYGIVSGVGDNKFAPNQTVTRQEAMVMIYNASKLMSLEDVANDNNWLDKFADFGTESKWATDAVKWNLANKIIVGNANGEIKPLDKLTRAEVTKMVLELLRRANLI